MIKKCDSRKNHLLKKRKGVWVCSILIVLMSLALAIFLQPKEADFKSYQQLMQISRPIQPDNKKEGPPVKQQRVNTRKDFLLGDRESKPKFKITSEGSEIVFDNQDEQTEIKELMSHVTCLMQDELFYVLPDGREVKKSDNGRYILRDIPIGTVDPYVEVDESQLLPMQTVRYILADKASYHYKSDRFEGHRVDLLQMILPTHGLNGDLAGGKITMRGTADKVQFKLFSGTPQFRAERLKAKFIDVEEIVQ